MKRYLNLGCGNRFSNLQEWTNLDFVATSDEVIGHNLLTGVPFEENSFDLVYHSHVLEHFSEEDGNLFLSECYRVLKPNGLIRIAVPDLEQIAREYLNNLERALNGDEMAKYDHQWIKLELFDQMVRHRSGGAMSDYLSQKNLPNEDYIFKRVGDETTKIRGNLLNAKNHGFSEPEKKKIKEQKGLKKRVKNWMLNKLIGNTLWKISEKTATHKTW